MKDPPVDQIGVNSAQQLSNATLFLIRRLRVESRPPCQIPGKKSLPRVGFRVCTKLDQDLRQGREGLAEALADGLSLADVDLGRRERGVPAPLFDLQRVVAADGHPRCAGAEASAESYQSAPPAAELR